MAKHIYKCLKCNIYTMKEVCQTCKEKTIRPIPPKYSPEDKYGKYRRIVKKQELENTGLV